MKLDRLRRLRAIVLASAIIFVAASTTMAQNPRGPHPMHLTRLIENLDLSDEQKEQVEAIIDKYEDDKESLVESLGEARERLQDVTFAEEYNEASVRQAAQQVSSIMEELAVLKAKMIAELRTVLSPEQIGYLKGRMEAMKEFRRHRRPIRGH